MGPWEQKEFKKNLYMYLQKNLNKHFKSLKQK